MRVYVGRQELLLEQRRKLSKTAWPNALYERASLSPCQTMHIYLRRRKYIAPRCSLRLTVMCCMRGLGTAAVRLYAGDLCTG